MMLLGGADALLAGSAQRRRRSVRAAAAPPAAAPAPAAAPGGATGKESRIGKAPIPLPKGVTVTLEGQLLTAKARRRRRDDAGPMAASAARDHGWPAPFRAACCRAVLFGWARATLSRLSVAQSLALAPPSQPRAAGAEG